MSKYVMTYDVGTTGIKTCLIEIDKKITILGVIPAAIISTYLTTEVQNKTQMNGGMLCAKPQKLFLKKYRT